MLWAQPHAVESPVKGSVTNGLLLQNSANEDDEVFFGPVGHKERCVAASLECGDPGPSPPRPPLPASESLFRWSPLAGEKFVEVYKEARLLALQIESSSRSAPALAGPGDAGSQGVERFIQESRLKMLLFEKENETKKSPSSLKRETYCLTDCPVGGPQLSGSQPPSGVGPARTQGPPRSSRPSLPVEPSPAHPPRLAGPQKKVVSRLPPPRAASVRGRSLHAAAEKVGPAAAHTGLAWLPSLCGATLGGGVRGGCSGAHSSGGAVSAGTGLGVHVGAAAWLR